MVGRVAQPEESPHPFDGSVGIHARPWQLPESRLGGYFSASDTKSA